MKPQIAASFTHWRTDWQTEMLLELEKGQRLLKRDKETGVYQLQKEIEQMKADHAAELKELEFRLSSSALTKEEQHRKALAQQLEEQKEKRIEHIQERAVHRLGRKDLSRGWQGWFDSYEEKQRHKRMLAAAAGRLMKPALTAALVHWRQDWHSELTRKLEEGQRLQKSLNKRSQAEHEEEVQRLQSELEAALRTVEQQRAALEGQEVSSPLAT